MYTIEEINNENPLLNSVLIENDKLNFRSSIYPNLGASLQQLSTNGIEIIDGITNDAEGLKIYKSKFNSSFLFPFPNRIPDGKYSFENKDYEIEINEPDLNNRLHGHIFNKKFSVKNKHVSENSANIIFQYSDNGTSKGYPFPFKLEISYTFTCQKISINFNVLNSGKTAFPFGIGWHPYFNSKNLSKSVLDFESENQYLVNNQMIPTIEMPLKFGMPLLIEDTFLDDCFITKQSKVLFKTNDYKIVLDFSSKTPNSFLQVYTPPTRNCIAIEPMTCAPNSFNNKNGLLTLQPAKKYTWKVNLNYSH